MVTKLRLGISTCLLGKNARYDGGHKLDHYLKDTLGAFVEWVPVCPELECGLGVPREAMHLTGDAKAPRLVTIRTGIDHTERMLKWALKKLDALEPERLSGFIFKDGSPSSGMRAVKVYNAKGQPARNGVGIFAGEFMKRFELLPVEDDGRLHDIDIRENFVERIFVYCRWQEFIEKDSSLKGLVSFHTEHKLIIMSHSPKILGELGNMVAKAKNNKKEELFRAYAKTLMGCLKIKADAKKNTNVLYHIMGYFKSLLSRDEKGELKEVIEDYHNGLIPIIVPVTILKHYIRKYDEPYIKKQYYLNPHPIELMLRNHV